MEDIIDLRECSYCHHLTNENDLKEICDDYFVCKNCYLIIELNLTITECIESLDIINNLPDKMILEKKEWIKKIVEYTNKLSKRLTQLDGDKDEKGNPSTS